MIESQKPLSDQSIEDVIKIIAAWQNFIKGVAMLTNQISETTGNKLYKVMKFDKETAAKMVGHPLEELEDYMYELGDA